MSWLLDQKNEKDFLMTCKESVINDEVFDEFRNSNSFGLIVENSPLKSGLEYYECILQQYPWLLDHMEKFITSDRYGSPKRYAIGKHIVSPSTMRYIKTLGDLVKFFGPLDGLLIAEIGAGYGGLCKIIHDVYTPLMYSLYDLPEAQSLQSKFLNKFNIHPNETEISVPAPSFDLLIAMYSWSELTKDTQIEYIQNVISKAKNCYIMLNYEMEESYRILIEAFPDADIRDHNLFYDDANTEYAPYNRFIIIKRK